MPRSLDSSKERGRNIYWDILKDISNLLELNNTAMAVTYALALSNLFPTSSQFTTFHQASTYFPLSFRYCK